MLPENFLLYLQILLFLFITPGTPRILIASYSMSYGVEKSIWTALGDISANTVQMIVVTFLIGSLLLSYPNIMIVMKWLGVTYLCYLAYELFKAKVKNFDSDKQSYSKTKMSFFRDGFLVAGLSPKAIIFIGTIFPNFMNFNDNFDGFYFLMILCFFLLMIPEAIHSGLSRTEIKKTNGFRRLCAKFQTDNVKYR